MLLCLHLSSLLLVTIVYADSVSNSIDDSKHHFIKWGNEIEYNDTSEPNVTSECVLKVCGDCVSNFRHQVYYSEASFAYLNLKAESGLNITGDEKVVGWNLWIWTFSGKEGSLEFLNWPIEFGIWSMGFLTSFVVKDPLTIKLKHVSGDCSNLVVGKRDSDMIISNALKELGRDMMRFNEEKYGPSFYCYKARKLILPHFAYILCKHIVCPVEALKYRCCTYYFNTTLQDRLIDCRENSFEYELFSWLLPTITSVILFAFCPLVLLYLAHKLCDVNPIETFTLEEYYSLSEEDSTTKDKIVVLNEHYPVTLCKTLFRPFGKSLASHICCIFSGRIFRMLLPFFSLSIVGIQICVDYFYLYDFVLTSISKGVPMGFRSMIAGYYESKKNFLPYLGGPFVAVGIYLFVTCLMLILPSSISTLLLTCVPDNTVSESISPLMLKLSSFERFGSKNIRRTRGYDKIYSTFLAQFFMVINSEFWKHAFSVQKARWERFLVSRCLLLFLPIYLIVCLVELVLCFAFFGFPIVSFGYIIAKAYCGRLFNYPSRRCYVRLIVNLLTPVIVASVVYFMFMFCTIFLDAILFIARIAMFTFTGIVIYPKVSYGYIIFAFTIVYYIWQSVQNFALIYHRLLKDTIAIAENLQRANDTHRLVVKVGDFKGISVPLFEHVIERHYPRRKQVFVSLMQVTILLTILGLLLNILFETDGFRELHVVMHVGTALFLCALPQIMKSMFHGRKHKYRQKRFRRELENSISNFMGYDIDCTTSYESIN